jgi:peptidoglycan-N-acetylglucosamine deacetylase
MWPSGKHCAVVVSVIFADGLDAVAVAPDLVHRSKSFSVWKYGAARGVERLSRTLERLGLRTSWFVPGQVAESHPDLMRAIAAAGHDIEGHGWALERYDRLPPAESLACLRRSREVLRALSGREATGFRLPAGNWPRHFDRVLREAGYQWSASLSGDDVPYAHPSGLVEIPVHPELEDRPYFQFNFTPPFPKGQGRLPPYDDVRNNWRMEFDAYRHFGLCYVLQLRPEWIGTPGRISLAHDLLSYIRDFDDVWLATGAAIAEWHCATGQSLPQEHPLNVYEAYLRERQVGG